MAKLVVISEAKAGLSHQLDTHWMTIGRAATNQFQILEASVSGQHCEVLLRGEELVVRDMRSTNGTFINDVMITEGVLKPGEVLRLGEIELKLEATPPVKQTPKISISVPGIPVTKETTQVEPTKKEETKFVKKQKVLLVD